MWNRFNVKTLDGHVGLCMRIRSLLALVSCVDLGPESVRCAVERRCHCLLPDFLALDIVETRLAVTVARHAVESRCEALAVQLEALRIAAIASLTWRALCVHHVRVGHFGLPVLTFFS